MEARKKECILEAASRAFAKLGFKKASIGQIAADAGVAKGTIYLACRSKQDLFYQVVLRDIREWLSDTGKAIDPRIPADEQLTQMAIRGTGFLEQRPLVRGLISGTHYGILPGWEERIDQLRTLSLANIVEVLQIGVKQGRFRKDIDLEEVASVLHDLQHSGYILQRRRGPLDPELVERRLSAALDLVLNGLRVRQPAEIN